MESPFSMANGKRTTKGNEMKLTSGFEDFGFGDTREACIEDAVASGCITRQEIEDGLEKFERTNVLGKGLYFTDDTQED